MRKLIVSMHVSLDGFVAGPNGEMNWIKIDDEMFDFVKTFTDNADAALYGKVTWQMMDNYWPTAADKPAATKHDKEHSEWYNRVQKFVVSNSLKGHKAGKTTFLSDDIVSGIQQVKQDEGNNILIFGSPSVVRILMQQNLVDEYWLFVNPVILGKGIPFFATTDTRISLTLKTTKTFSSGVIALNYSNRT